MSKLNITSKDMDWFHSIITMELGNQYVNYANKYIYTKKGGKGKPPAIYDQERNEIIVEAIIATANFHLAKNETDIRKENKENKEKNIIPYPLTEFCFGAELENQILIWLKYKTSEKKDSYKEIGFKALLIKIKQNSEKYGEQAIIDLINESISNNWKGIIWDKLLNEKEKEKPKSKLKMVEIPDEFKEVM